MIVLNPTEIIRKKRDGGTLSREEMEFLIKGNIGGTVPDYQLSAFLMAVYFRGMSPDESMTFTDIMLQSGKIVDLSGVAGVKVDKHSTGGVGDKVSLILAPMVAACGVPVPMISGRGLGHTGGTLDKLESIPGFRTDLSLDEYRRVIAEIGAVMIGQTDDIAPADRKMYALRDVTGTIECIPLIAGSIMSKKLAEGIDALVLDVKTGRGAFMRSEDQAIELAKTLIAIGERFNKRTVAFITDMNQPLGYAVGNWLEVVESIECLRGSNVPDLMELTYVLGAAMLMIGGKVKTIDEGIEKCRSVVQSGAAFRKFVDLVNRQGGDASFIDHPERYPASAHRYELKSSTSGDVDFINALEVGFVGIMLGAGRVRMDDMIDPKAGIVLKKKVGDSVQRGETIAVLHTDRKDLLEKAAHRLERAFGIATEPSIAQPLVKAMVDRDGIRPWHGYSSKE
jgi:pyrimidine-nucleoside phosphorylase